MGFSRQRPSTEVRDGLDDFAIARARDPFRLPRMIDHDRLFKELLTTFFTDFVDLLLPEMSAYFAPDSVVFLEKEVFTDVTEGERHEADVVARARFRGEDSCFLVHVETQAQAQPGFARRMFLYFARLHEKHALPVYPIVVFSHDSPRLEPAQYGVKFPDLEVLRFQFRSFQLRQMRWRDHLRRAHTDRERGGG